MLTHWSDLATGRTSDQLVEVLINEILYGNTQTTDDQPSFVHRRMRRRITGLLIKEIWSSKLFDGNQVCGRKSIGQNRSIIDL